jgi:hypothetical protein
MKLLLKTLTTLTVLLAVFQAQAATIDFNGGGATTEWNVGTSWSGGVAPVNGDTARLQFGDNATVTSTVNAGSFNILQRNSGTLAIGANFKTVLTYDLGTSGNGDTTTTHTDGLLVGRTLKIGNDSSTDIYEAKYTISGGTTRFTTAVTISKNGIFEIDGNGGNIQFNNASASAVTMGEGTISYKLGATGVSAITNLGSGGSFNIASGSKLVIDASNYTGGISDIDLVTSYTNIVGSFTESNISITGLEAGLSASITYDTGQVALSIIPEPGTYVMLGGLFALGFVMMRRR